MSRISNESFKLGVCAVGLWCLLFPGPTEIKAQDERKFEIGGQFTFLKLKSDIRLVPTQCPQGPTTCIVSVFSDNQDLSGFGARFGYRLSKHFGVESELNFFPKDEITTGRKLQAFFGIKAGQQFDRLGLFFKLRPGLIHSTRGTFTPNGDCPIVLGAPGSPLCAAPSGVNDFALDIGGIVELHTSKRTFIRFDAGDLFVRNGRHLQVGGLNFANSGTAVIVPIPASTKHNFQTSVGFGLRF